MSKRSPSKWTVEALAAYVEHGGVETASDGHPRGCR